VLGLDGTRLQTATAFCSTFPPDQVSLVNENSARPPWRVVAFALTHPTGLNGRRGFA